MAKKSKSFFKLTPAERAAVVARFDRGVAFEDTTPLSTAQQARFERAKKSSPAARGETKDARVLISLDPKLLARAHARAKREGKSFSKWVSELLQAAERRVG